MSSLFDDFVNIGKKDIYYFGILNLFCIFIENVNGFFDGFCVVIGMVCCYCIKSVYDGD